MSETLPCSDSPPSNSRVAAVKVSLADGQTPSATRATTNVLVDDVDVDLRPGIGDTTEEPLMRH